MSKKCLKQAFVYHGFPVSIISLTTILLGIAFLMLGNESGWAFILVSIGIMSIFSLLGARNGCLAEMVVRRRYVNQR